MASDVEKELVEALADAQTMEKQSLTGVDAWRDWLARAAQREAAAV